VSATADTFPLVTIGVTAYNAENSVERAIRSALAQTWQPIEIIAVDDASRDGTAALLRALARDIPELRVFENPTNGGVAASRNRILTQARGEFVAFFDDDDESLPERVAAQIDRLRRYETEFAAGAPVICHTARLQRFPDGSEHIAPTLGAREGVRAPNGPTVAARILLGSPLTDGYGACATCSQLARRATYRRLDGFDPDFRRSEDTEFNIRLALTGGHFVGVARPLVKQVMTATSEKGLAEEHRHACLLLEKHRPFAEAAGQYQFCQRWLDLRQAWRERRRIGFVGIMAGLLLRHPILTLRRMGLALPGLGLNRQQGRFHRYASRRSGTET